MDAKEILRIMVQNRFWIVLGIASLLPIIGYFVTAGAVKEATAAKVSEIDQAQKGAEGYRSGAVANGQYAEFTKPKINAIEEDVAKAHERLYKRQAPLLDWPEEIEPQLTAWGRDIPENVGPDEQDSVSYLYTRVYDDYAKDVYELFDPWDPVEGEGLVEAPPMESLLQTVEFDPNDLPTISEVWQYQENLWVRRSILEVIAEVNKKAGARDWESAQIKRINELEVGTMTAVDHRTTAKGVELKEPEEVTQGGQSLTPEEPAAPAGGMGGMEGMMGMESMMAGYGGMGGGMGGGAVGTGEPVKFIQPEGAELFRDYPAFVSVLIDQSSIQNFLVEFENSPMSMRVLEANWVRPSSRIQPPVKGQGFGGYMGGMFGRGSGGGLMGMAGMEGMMGGYGMGYGGMDGGGMMPGGMEMGMMGGMGMGYGGGGFGGAAPSRLKKKRDLNERKPESPEENDPEKVTIFDPYYNIVELQVYVQARFFYPPDEVAAVEGSQNDPGLSEDAAIEVDPSSPPVDGQADPSTVPDARPLPVEDDAIDDPAAEVFDQDAPADPVGENSEETPAPAVEEPSVLEEPAVPGATEGDEPSAVGGEPTAPSR